MNATQAIRVVLIGQDESLEPQLRAAGFEVIRIAEDGDMYAAVAEHEPQAVLLRSDSPSRDTLEHLASLGRRYPQPALLLHGADQPELSRQALNMGLSAYVTEGLNATMLKSLVEVSIQHARQVHALRRELARSQKSLAERKRIDQAKRVLWQRHGMNEDAAYKVLKRLAMNARCSIAEAATRVLDNTDDTS